MRPESPQHVIAHLSMFLLAFAASPIGAQESIPALVKAVQPAVVTIHALDAGGKELKQGSGFLIDRTGLVATNAHVIRGASRMVVSDGEGQTHTVSSIVAQNIKLDLAILRVPGKDGTPKKLNIAMTMPEVGERIMVIGSPLGLEQTVSDGIISAIRNLPDVGKILQITAPISPGSSGSPVVNNRGEVVGVATFNLRGGESLNFAIPGTEILNMLPQASVPAADNPDSQMGPVPAPRGNIQSPYIQGLGYFVNGDYKQALPFLELAASKLPKSSELWSHIGVCNSELGRSKEAIDAFKLATHLNPGDASLYFKLGSALARLNRWAEALDAYSEATRLRPDFYEAFFNAGVVNTQLGRYAEAVEAYRRSVKSNPQYAKAYVNMGSAYRALRRYAEELEAYKCAVTAQPDNPTARLSFGLALLQAGDRGGALQQYVLLKPLNEQLAAQLYAAIYN